MTMQSRLGLTYTHPTGLSFSHPADWSVQATSDGLILTPGPGGRTSGGITESYMVMTEAAPGLRDPGGRQIAELMDELIASQAPGLHRTEGPVQAPCRRGRGARMLYAGQTRTGQEVRAVAFVSLHEELSASLIGLGPAEAVQAHLNVLADIFASFCQTPSQQDQDLVGTWYCPHHRDGGYVSSAGACLELRADGTFEQFEMVGPAVGGPVRGEPEDSAPRVQGYWHSSADSLEMVHPNGRREPFTYSITAGSGGRRLHLLHNNGTQQSWSSQPAG